MLLLTVNHTDTHVNSQFHKTSLEVCYNGSLINSRTVSSQSVPDDDV